MKHVSSGLRVGLAMVVCAAVLAPSALADNGKKPEDGPGNSGNAPGHNKDSASAPPQAVAPETSPPEPPPSSAPAEGAPAASQGPTAAAKHEEPPAAAVAQPAAKAPGPEQSKHPEKSEKPDAKTRPVGGGEPSKSSGEASAHRKVLICHATGSTTNPFVLISVSVHAWSDGRGHGAHADDVFVDWSWPGDPRQRNDALCPASRRDVPPTTTTTTTPHPSTKPSASTPADPDSQARTAVADPRASGEARPGERSATLAPPATATKLALVTASGLLADSAVRGTLPFTGLPLWAAGLTGFLLLGLGLVLRRRTALRA